MSRLLAVIALLLLLVACVPTTGPAGGDKPVTIIVNAPRENAVPGLADALESALKQEAHCCSFDIHWSMPVRAQEGQRDLFSHRAWIAAAAMARNLNADWALLIGSHGYSRVVEERGDWLHITVTTGVRLHITNQLGERLAAFDSLLLRGSRTQPATRELVDENREPLLQQLAQDALADVSGPAVSWLNSQISGSNP